MTAHEAPESARQALALAGALQGTMIVDDCANGRPVDLDAEAALLRAVLTVDAETLDDVVPRVSDLRQGLRALAKLSVRPDDRMLQPLRYLMSTVELSRALGNHTQISERLSRELAALNSNGIDDDDAKAMAASLAGVYEATVSRLPKRVRVTGQPQLLRDTRVAQRIRSVLLSSIRFAWLWNQYGGRRWHLVFRRKQLAADANEWLRIDDVVH